MGVAASTHPVDLWLARNNLSRRWLADEIPTHEVNLSRYISGQVWPPRWFFERLAEITADEVTADSFIRPPPGPPKRKNARASA